MIRKAGTSEADSGRLPERVNIVCLCWNAGAKGEILAGIF